MKKIDARFMSLSEEIIFTFQSWIRTTWSRKTESTLRISNEKIIPVRSLLNMHRRHAGVDALIGSFQPFAAMIHDFSLSFKGYRSSQEITLGLWQPVRGLNNLIKASIQIILIALRLLLSPLIALSAQRSYRFIDRVHNPHFLVEKISPKTYLKRVGIIWGDAGLNLIHTVGLIIRGTIQLITTPLIPIRILMRRFQTWRNKGYSDFSMNEETIRLIQFYDQLYHQLPANREYLEITPDTDCSKSKSTPNPKYSVLNQDYNTECQNHTDKHDVKGNIADEDIDYRENSKNIRDIQDMNSREKMDPPLSQTVTDIGTTVWLLHQEFLKWQHRGQSLAHPHAKSELKYFSEASKPKKWTPQVSRVNSVSTCSVQQKPAPASLEWYGSFTPINENDPSAIPTPVSNIPLQSPRALRVQLHSPSAFAPVYPSASVLGSANMPSCYRYGTQLQTQNKPIGPKNPIIRLNDIDTFINIFRASQN